MCMTFGGKTAKKTNATLWIQLMGQLALHYRAYTTARFIKPNRDPVHNCTGSRFYEMGDRSG